ncbi:DoxX family protein [Teichococcus oryzae]|uniref:DoxX family protein n=1 Tax=Teichococcus oryzae TaxID=1608942 RepID=A0A5B2TI01_9PROT|nr:DoxX family protein [Pseudoroseomonas oryzae]KAA2213733.1 DoxX family protein [Pseudoroseomonas oryzae]
MPHLIGSILNSALVELLARVLLTLPFWGSGMAKLIDFEGGVAEMAMFGLNPPALFNTLTIITQLGGSVLVILNRWTWLGAGALGVFTALTIPIVHRFWAMEGDRAIHAFHTATEHVGMIGGLVIVSVLAHRQRGRSRQGLLGVPAE